MPVLLSSALHAHLLAEAIAAHPLECCGLVFGTEGSIERIQPTANIAADPARTFEIDPAALIAAERAMRDGGDTLMGYYHSHPDGRAAPSACDAANAAGDGRVWLIIGGDTITAWQAVKGGPVQGGFAPIGLAVVDGPPD